MAGLGDTDGYEGTAVVEAGGSRFDVHVRLRGHFQPIDGRYHWYGRISAHDGLDGALGSGKAAGVLTTAEGSAPCELSEPDPSRRYRVTGISTPPFRTAGTAAGIGTAGISSAGPDAAGLIRPAIGAGLLGGGWRQAGPRLVLRAHRREGLRGDAQELADRELRLEGGRAA